MSGGDIKAKWFIKKDGEFPFNDAKGLFNLIVIVCQVEIFQSERFVKHFGILICDKELKKYSNGGKSVQGKKK